MDSSSLGSHVFLEGPAGTGKTTRAIEHLHELLQSGVLPTKVLVLVPQRTLGRPYQLAMASQGWVQPAGVDIATFGGVARRTLELFWTQVAAPAGFFPERGEPTFLTIETAQYYMARFVDQVVATGAFDGVALPRARLIAQSLDNLAKSAINRFAVSEVAERLGRAWGGHSSRLNIYQSWLEVARAFRQFCFENNLLDFSLQIEAFVGALVGDELIQNYVLGKYDYLIADNLEENFPVTLDFIRWLSPSLRFSFFVYDSDAGYRVFLGADPVSAKRLYEISITREVLNTSVVQSLSLQALTAALTDILDKTRDLTLEEEAVLEAAHPTAAFQYAFHTFYPQMLNWAIEQVVRLIQEQHIEPHQIVIVAPYLNDSLRFTLTTQLEKLNIPFVTHRPSRALRDEPAARTLLTWMALINPYEQQPPHPADLTDTLVQSIDGLDPIRARLLASIVYGEVGKRELGSFDEINTTMQTRITYRVGERYDYLRNWLLEQRQKIGETPPDYFLRSLFGDVLSQPGFGFHASLEAGSIATQLVDSAYSFRQALYPNGTQDWTPVWRNYRELVSEGLLAAVHTASWQKEETNALFIAPAYTYLMRNRPVDFQIWLDVGSMAWSERLDQPLTHPYVLQRDYPPEQVWSDDDETGAQREMLRKLVLGLVRRCRRQVYLAIADLGEQGFEQRGPLLRLFQHVLQVYGQEDAS